MIKEGINAVYPFLRELFEVEEDEETLSEIQNSVSLLVRDEEPEMKLETGLKQIEL